MTFKEILKQQKEKLAKSIKKEKPKTGLDVLIEVLEEEDKNKKPKNGN